MKKVVITYNTSHYIFAFKYNLIKSLQNNGYKVVVIAPYDEYSDKFKEINVDYFPVTIDNKGSNPIKDLILVKDLYKLYKISGADIILNFTIKPNIYGTLAAKMLNIPVINNITGLGTIFLRGGLSLKIVKTLYKMSLKFSNKTFFQNNDDMKLFLENKLISENKIDLLPGSGVDIEKFKFIQIDKSDKFTFILIGRMIKDKGLLEYVEAAKIIHKTYDNIEFQLLGEAGVKNFSAITLDELKEWEDKNIVTYLGATNDVRPYIAKSDVVVLPSYSEGMPRTLLEASAMCKPIIGTNVPGCKDIVFDGINGYLCNIKDSIDLALKMKQMIEMKVDALEKMGKNGRQIVVDKFDEKIVLDKYLVSIKQFLEAQFTNKKTPRV